MIRANHCFHASIVVLLVLVQLAAVSARPAWAEQAMTFSISGRITDSQQAPVANVDVWILWPDGEGAARSNSSGDYLFSGVPSGHSLEMQMRAPLERRLADRNYHLEPLTANLVKNIQLVPGRLFSGQIRLIDGAPARYTGVQALPLSFELPYDEYFSSYAEDAQASFRMVLPLGVYRLTLHGLPFGAYDPRPAIDLRVAEITGHVLATQAQPKPAYPTWPPPVASRIHIGPADHAGNATIRGDPGAVPPFQFVLVGSLDTRLWTQTLSEADGSFATQLFAPPGSTILIKYRENRFWVESFAHPLTALPATLLRVPLSPGATTSELGTGSYSLGCAGSAFGGGDKSDARWWMVGTLSTPGSLNVRPGDTLRVSGTVRLAADAMGAGFDARSVRVRCAIAFSQLFDGNGREVESMEFGFGDHQFMSTLMTPTGLPIERDSEDLAPRYSWTEVTGLHTVASGVLEGLLTLETEVPGDLPPGMYAPRLTLEVTGLPYQQTPLADLWVLDRGVNEGYLPILRVGDAQTPRLVTHLLSNSYTGGTRGALAREDVGRFDLVTMVAYQPKQCIVPRTDAYGALIRYDLGPFLPMLSYTDRSFPVLPLVPLQFPTNSVEITVKKPDGSTARLGPAPLQQSYTWLPSTVSGDVVHLGAPFLADVYHLTNVDQVFHYAFDQYGHHVITMSGTLRDVWGHSYRVGGTYDVWVARELDMDCGQLPTTPYQVNDDFAPIVQVYPRVPAQVEATLTLLPNSDPHQAIVRTARGEANSFGYFHASSGSFALTQPGEFRVDVTAAYTETNGTLWIASYTWGNVVETPNTPLVAHGRRGIDNAPQTGLQWFLWSNLSDADRKDHIYYPYQHGDVTWANFLEVPGGDALIPAATFHDTRGELRALMEQRNLLPHSALSQGPEAGDFATRVALGEIPLFNAISDGRYPDRYPEAIDQWGYAYRSSERPGVRVRELVCEDSNIFGYWRYDDMYGGQIGMGHKGDLPNDYKLQFVGVVLRDVPKQINQYAIYAASWVLLPEDDPVGSRVMPPYRGAGGGPQDGGPLMTIRGEDIDVLFLPLGTQPGTVLEVGDTFSFSGHVVPTLDSRVTATVRSPSGTVVCQVDGHANKVGWFYEPSGDFAVQEPGAWTVEVRVVHDRVYPAIGSVPTRFNSGTVLGAVGSRYTFYVVPRESPRLTMASPKPGTLRWPEGLAPVEFRGTLPPDWENAAVHYTITTPGFVLAQGTAARVGGSFSFSYDPLATNRDFGIIDLMAAEERRPGLSDEVLVTVFASSGPQHRAATVTLFGERVMIESDPAMRPRAFLPLAVRAQR